MVMLSFAATHSTALEAGGPLVRGVHGLTFLRRTSAGTRSHSDAVRALLGTTSQRSLAASTVCHAKKGKGKAKEENVYSPTVNLPMTNFNIRAMAKEKEPEIQSFWDSTDVYNTLVAKNSKPYTLHDGPPYANGDLHIGHALNKIIKDIINKRKLLEGYKAKFVPGWDTHGLPIELKVLQTLSEEERRGLTPIELRKMAREFALRTVDSQRTQFKRFGVWGSWDSPYITLEPAYEAAQIHVFGQMVLKGHIYRGRKPVNWSPSSRTALAEAELEYPDNHKSKSIYVSMPIKDVPEGCDAALAEALKGAALSVWTTTPWTIPANLAVAVNEILQYSVVQLPEGVCDWLGNRRIVVAHDLIATIAAKLKTEADALTVLATVPGSALEGCTYQHPICDRSSPVVIGGDYITTEAGTGLVHTAPGHGQEDYTVGQRYGLPLLSPVDDAGLFTAEAGQFEGLAVQGEGNLAVIQALKEVGVLLRVEDYKHKYPYDWRTKKPTIFRATEQWFASVEAFRQNVLDEIENVHWQPAVGKNRITSMVEGRNDWCISRQRTWGVPIPVFYYKESKEPLMTEETIAHVEAVVQEHGSDAWWTFETVDLLPEKHKAEADQLERGTDTMDVWFDSGSSWAAVCRQNDALSFPADLYMEGSDQHRGWFQSSLLTSVAVTGRAPYKKVLTHGFVLDEKGQKQSKSLGNVVDPLLVIEGGANVKKQPAYGADVLRLWVASVDYTVDVGIGDAIIKQVFESYRKVRGTLRFMLGNLHDFNPAEDAVQSSDLPLMDRYMLSRLRTFLEDVKDAYTQHNFSAVYRATNVFVTSDLSSTYFELAKDRLYIRALSAPQRRSCQTVLHSTLCSLLATLAPVLSHTCEDAWQHMPHKDASVQSVFEQGIPESPLEHVIDHEELQTVHAALAIKDVALKALETAREAKDIGAPLDACVVLEVADPQVRERLQCMNTSVNGVDPLKYLFVTSQVVIVDKMGEGECPHVSEAQLEGLGAVKAGVRMAAGSRCERCWHYCGSVGSSVEHPQVCERCMPVVEATGFKLPVAPVKENVAAA